MTNSNEILERILLNMKYDSKKTLSENKSIILNEEIDYCKKLKADVRSKLTNFKKGTKRAKDGSDKYGTWGDGKAFCCNKPGHQDGTFHADCLSEDSTVKPGKSKWKKPWKPGMHSPHIDKAIEISQNHKSQWGKPLTKKNLVSTYDYNGKKLEFFGHIIETVGDFFNPILNKINSQKEGSYRDQRNGMWIPYGDANELKNGTGFYKDINYNEHRLKNVEGGWKYQANMVWKYKDRTNCHTWGKKYFTNNQDKNRQDEDTCFIVDQAEKCRTYLQSKIYKKGKSTKDMQVYDSKNNKYTFNRNLEYQEDFLDPPEVLDCVKKSTEDLIDRLGEKTPYKISVYLPIHAKMGYDPSQIFTLVFKGVKKSNERWDKPLSVEMPYKEGIEVLGYQSKEVSLRNKYGVSGYDIYLDYQKDNNIEHTKPYKINDVCLWLKNPNSKYYYKKGWDYERLVTSGKIADTPNNQKIVNDCLSNLNDLDLLNGGESGDQTKPKIEGEKDGNVEIPNAIDINLKGNSDDITPRKGGTITLQLSGGG